MLDFLKKLFGSKPRVFKTDIPRRFELLGRVGQGTMSKVWRARDSHSGQIVALKVLDKLKTLKFESRFVGLKKPLEGEVAVKLEHPNIVKTFSHGITLDDEQFLVMEFVDGIGLSYLIETQNETMLTSRLKFMIELAEALAYFHSQGWIHRDIGPRNVIVDTTSTLKLIDFGLAVPNTPEFRKPGNRTGTANYMAPELIKRRTTDHRIDIFSYAVTCFEMWTKHLPWEAADSIESIVQHINKPPAEITSLVPDIDAQIAATIMKGLERDPDSRWQSMEELLVPLREAEQRLRPAKKKRKS